MYGTVAMCSVLPENAERLMALAAAEDGLGIGGYLARRSWSLRTTRTRC